MKNIQLNLRNTIATATLMFASTAALAINESGIPDHCQKHVSELQAQYTDEHLKRVQSAIPYVISAFREGSPRCMSLVFEYPWDMPSPLSQINTPAEMERRLAEVVDTNIQLQIAQSSIDDWSAMGWRGSMLANGSVWTSESGGITVIHEETVARKTKIAEKLEIQKAYLHPSLHDFEQSILSWNSNRFNIRVDRIGADQYRYAGWKGGELQSSKPDLVLTNGKYYSTEGSMSYPMYEFTNGNYVYTVSQAWSPESPDHQIGELFVSQNRADGTEDLLANVVFFENHTGMPMPLNRIEFVEQFMRDFLANKPIFGRGLTHIDYRHKGTTYDLYSARSCDRTFEKTLTNVPVAQFTELLERHLGESFDYEQETWPNRELQYREFPGEKGDLVNPVSETVPIGVVSITVDEARSTFSFFFTNENDKDKLVQISVDTLCLP